MDWVKKAQFITLLISGVLCSPTCVHMLYENEIVSNPVILPMPRNGHCVLYSSDSHILLTNGHDYVKDLTCNKTNPEVETCRCSDCSPFNLIARAKVHRKGLKNILESLKDQEKFRKSIHKFCISTAFLVFGGGIAVGTWVYNLHATPDDTKTFSCRVKFYCYNALLAAGGLSIVPSLGLFIFTTFPSINDLDKALCASYAFAFLSFSLICLLMGQCTEMKKDEETGKYLKSDIMSVSATGLAVFGNLCSIALVGFSNSANSFNAMSASLGLVIFIANGVKNMSEVAKANPSRSAYHKAIFGPPIAHFTTTEEDLDITIRADENTSE